MKKIKSISLLMALLMVFMLLAGCGKEESTEEDSTVSQDENVENEDSNDSQENPENNSEQVKYDGIPGRVTATKVRTISSSELKIGRSKYGFYYKENDKYGIFSYDGAEDTGAKYYYCKENGDYFEVITEIPTDSDLVDSINHMGLVDAGGKVIIPEEYCYFKMLNDRFVRVIKATEQVDSKEDALIYISNSKYMSIFPQDGDYFFKGVWYVYDLTTGKKVPNATGTNAYNVSATGNSVSFVTDDNKRCEVFSNGQQVPNDIEVFSDGSYKQKNGDSGIVYDMYGNKLFSYSTKSFVPFSVKGEYYLASCSVDSTVKCAFLDKSGNKVSVEFEKQPRQVFGELFTISNDAYKDEIYRFDGNKFVAGDYDNIKQDEKYQLAYFLKKDDNYTLVNSEGTVIYEGVESSEYDFDTYSFTICKKVGNDKFYYCLKDEDFTIKGYSVLDNWLVTVRNEDYTYSVIDTVTGEKLVSGYYEYSVVNAPGGKTYIYAELLDGGYDIYVVK